LTDDFAVGDLTRLDDLSELVFDASEPVTIDIPVRPPNQVREEAGLDMPVQVEERGQLVERFIPPAKYKGRLKPNGKKPSTASMDTPTVPGTNPVSDEVVEQFGIQTR
jgi:hypothetical protein